MSDTPLFPDDVSVDEPAPRPDPGPLPAPRLRRANRGQMLLRPSTLEELLPDDHDARTIWAVVCSVDLGGFLEKIRARGEEVGRAATDPPMLVALWLYAATRGVASARERDRLGRASDPYRWIGGEVTLNYHTLSDFRVAHGAALDGLLTQLLTALIQGPAVAVEGIAQDGTRVRVSAGASSFKKRDTLEQARQKAEAPLAIIGRPADRLEEATVRRQKAEHRAAQAKLAWVEEALKQLAEVATAKAEPKDKPTKQNPPKASTTDPEARFLRMPDGGSRPAFNVQLAGATESRAVVGVEVTNAGSDAGLSEPLRQQVEARTGGEVKEQLLDGGYTKLEAVDQATADETTLYLPVPKPRKAGTDPHPPKRGDSPAVRSWRGRMATPEAKEISKQRAATIETVNGELKTVRGLGRFLGRGLHTARWVALWSVLAYNVVPFGMQCVRLTG